MSKSCAVAIHDLSVYYGRTPALTGICLNVPEGEVLGIIGPNGGGKSTLLKALLGLVKPAEGTIRIYGKSPGKNRGLVGYVPQNAALDRGFPITLFEVVLSGRLRGGLAPFFRYSRADREVAEGLLETVGIADLKERQISQLSGGEFQRMLIARALAVEPRLLLLDEPTASVDASSRARIYELLGRLSKDMTIVLVTHDLLAVSSRVTSLACLNEKLVYHGEPQLTEGIVQNVYGCPVDLIAHGVPHRVLRNHEEGQCCDSCDS